MSCQTLKNPFANVWEPKNEISHFSGSCFETEPALCAGLVSVYKGSFFLVVHFLLLNRTSSLLVHFKSILFRNRTTPLGWFGFGL